MILQRAFIVSFFEVDDYMSHLSDKWVAVDFDMGQNVRLFICTRQATIVIHASTAVARHWKVDFIQRQRFC